jgi:hypothetical protein
MLSLKINSELNGMRDSMECYAVGCFNAIKAVHVHNDVLLASNCFSTCIIFPP